ALLLCGLRYNVHSREGPRRLRPSRTRESSERLERASSCQINRCVSVVKQKIRSFSLFSEWIYRRCCNSDSQTPFGKNQGHAEPKERNPEDAESAGVIHRTRIRLSFSVRSFGTMRFKRTCAVCTCFDRS